MSARTKIRKNEFIKRLITSIIILYFIIVVLIVNCDQREVQQTQKPIQFLVEQSTSAIKLEFSETRKNLVRFVPHGHGLQVKLINNILTVSSATNDAIVWTEVSIEDASFCNVIDVTLRQINQLKPSRFSSQSGQNHRKQNTFPFGVTWKKEGEEEFPGYQRIVQHLTFNQQDWKTYRFYLSENGLWHGKISAIGFVLPSNICIEIAKIILEKQDVEFEAHLLDSRYRIGSQTRPARLLTVDERMETNCYLSEDSILTFGCVPVQLIPSNHFHPLDLELVIWSKENKEEVLLKTSYTFHQNQLLKPTWQDYSLPLLPEFTGNFMISWTCRENTKLPEGENLGSCLALSQPLIMKRQKAEVTNVILISIDTLRADHLGCYGYPLSLSPNIDYLSRRGVLFNNAITPYPSTTPAHISLLTGLYPFQHGVLKGKNRMSFFTPTLASYFSNQGYLTYAVTGGGNVDAYHRFDNGFLIYDDGDRSINSLQHRLIPILEKHTEQQFFAFYHTYEVHAPFTPHKPLIEYLYPNYSGPVRGDELIDKRIRHLSLEKPDLDYMVALYDAGIRYADIHLASLFSFIKHNNLFRDTCIVLVSDHGEHFSEHGLFGHGNSLFSPLVNVPVIFSYPGRVRRGVILTNPLNLIDIPQTIFTLLGFTNFSPPSSHDYAKSIISGQPDEHNVTFSEVRTRTRDRKSWIDGFAWFEDDYKLILSLPEGEKKLFRIPSQEMPDDNILYKKHEQSQIMEEKLKNLLSCDQNCYADYEEGTTPRDIRTERLLQALGYLE